MSMAHCAVLLVGALLAPVVGAWTPAMVPATRLSARTRPHAASTPASHTLQLQRASDAQMLALPGSWMQRVGAGLAVAVVARKVLFAPPPPMREIGLGLRPSRWYKLRSALGSAGSVAGAAAAHSLRAREEAARRLIGNHDMVLRDLTDQEPVTQTELQRLPAEELNVADGAIFEACRRLLGLGIEESVVAASAEEKATWAATADLLNARIQSTFQQRIQCGGRKPDMSPEAADALRDVFAEIVS
tara:strand:- start:278 stop:1012 length:735 start_codon:yes stop_codon:yes gene_type:complete